MTVARTAYGKWICKRQLVGLIMRSGSMVYVRALTVWTSLQDDEQV